MRIFFYIAFFSLFTSICGEEAVRINNGRLNVAFVDPAQPLPQKINYRFVKFGWIKFLAKNKETKSIFRTRPLMKSHPASGCAMEFTPSIALTGSKKHKLKLGVGIIEENPTNHFLATLIKPFPWQTTQYSQNKTWYFKAVQRSDHINGYAYILSITIEIQDGSSKINYHYELQNTGQKALSCQTYIHPFFEAEINFPDSWVHLEKQSPEKVIAGKNRNIAFHKNEAPLYGVAGGRTGHYTLHMSCSKPLSLVKIWNDSKDCFAIEPHINIDLASGQSMNWTWSVVAF